MSRVLTIEDSKRKSSRSKADLFEVLIAIELTKYYGLDTNSLKRENNKLEQEISKFVNGERRTEEQYKRARILIPCLIKKLDTEIVPIYGKPSEIKWIGRKWQKEETTSDIDIVFKSGDSIGISLKSTRHGKGTQKNIGYAKLRQLLGIDINRELNEMWNMIRKDISERGGNLLKIAQKSHSEIKEAKYKYPAIQEIGNKRGLLIQKLAVDQSVILFNKLSKKHKLIFLEGIFETGTIKQLLNALVEDEIPKLYWNEIAQDFLRGNLLAEKLTDKSYHIVANGRPILRLQASFTNGIGLSAFCERAFLIS